MKTIVKTKLTRKKRYKLWKKWKKHNLNSRAYQYLVLFGVIESPTFRVEILNAIYQQEHEERQNAW